MAIKPSISPISAQIAGFLSIIPYPKPLFIHLAYSIQSLQKSKYTKSLDTALK